MNKKYRVEFYSKDKGMDSEPIMSFVVTSLEEVTVRNFDYFFLVSEVL